MWSWILWENTLKTSSPPDRKKSSRIRFWYTSLDATTPEASLEIHLKVPCPEGRIFSFDHTYRAPWTGIIRRIYSLHFHPKKQKFSPREIISTLSDRPLPGREIKRLIERTSVRSQAAALRRFLKNQKLPLLEVGEGYRLEPVYIHKPWGREIWYTGIESRGVSAFRTGAGPVLLPDAIATFPKRFTGPWSGTPILVKILDPLPDEDYGDLYLELHETKQEVYVVSGLSSRAWPRGVGQLKYGVNPQKRNRYPNFTAYKIAFREALTHYEQCRKEIDEKLENQRHQEGFASDEPIPPSIQKKWRRKLDRGLREEEQRRKSKVDKFIGAYPLRVGDVLRVETRVPHSLQHGVRCVEFQTPTYERLILSFHQRVLTQNHWDVAAGLAKMRDQAPHPQHLELIHRTKGQTTEQVARFQGFEVWRVTLSPKTTFSSPWTDRYHLVFSLLGSLKVEIGKKSSILRPEQCFFLPCADPSWKLSSRKTKAVFLLAYPR